MIKLYNGDCLELMRDIPDGSVDLILADPPYGTMKGQGQSPAAKNLNLDNCEWDNKLPTEPMFSEFSRILRPNGRCVVFAQEPYTSELIRGTVQALPFSYRAIWLKNSTGNPLKCKKAMLCFYEDICIFQKPSIKLDYAKKNPLREKMKKYVDRYGKEYIIALFLNEGRYSTEASARVHASYKFAFNKGNRTDLMDKKLYEHLSEYIEFEEEYEELSRLYNDYQEKNTQELLQKWPSVFNLWQGGKYKSNVLEYPKDYGGLHPTQKPVALIEDLIQTFSNPGDTVLDCCMGSGTTGVACVNTGRRFIGIELDHGYFEIAQKRIEEVTSQIKMEVSGE